MAGQAIGTIGVELEARLAKFESDMGRAGRIVQQEIQKMNNRLDSQLRQMNAKLSQFANGVSRQISTMFGAISLGAIVEGLREVADGYANIQAKLKLVTTGQQQLAAASAEVYAVAQRSFTSLDATTTLVLRTAKALQGQGRDQAQALQLSLKLSETINKAFAVSGTTGVEAKNAIIQLSQALGSGTLRADEFRSVSEQGQRIMQALADSLHVTTGELKAMSQEGKLTTEVIVKALLEAAPKIESEFKNIPITISRAFTLLSNSFMKYIGDANEANGTSRALASGIKFLADNLDIIIPLLAALAAGVLINSLVGLFTAGAAVVGAFATSIAVSIAPMSAFIAGASTMGNTLGFLGTAIAALDLPLVAAVAGIVALGAALYSEHKRVVEFEDAVKNATDSIALLKSRQNELSQEGPPSFTGQQLGQDMAQARDHITKLDQEITKLKDHIDQMKNANLGLPTKDIEDAEAAVVRLNDQWNEGIRLLAKLAGAQREMAAAEKERNDNAANLALREEDTEKWIKAAEKATKALREQNFIAEHGKAAWIENRTALAALEAQNTSLAGAVQTVGKAWLDAQRRADALAAAKKNLKERTKELSKEEREYFQQINELERLHERELMKDEEARIKLTQATDEYNRRMAEMLQGLQDDSRLAGLSEEAHQQLANAIKAEEIARKFQIDSYKTKHRMSEQERQDLALEIKLELDHADAVRKTTRTYKEFYDVQKQNLEVFEEALTKLFLSGLQGWKDFGQSLERIAANSLDAIVKMFRETVLTPNGGGWGQFVQNMQGATAGPMGYVNAAAGIYSTYQQARSGNRAGATVSGAVTGAEIGTMILPGIGTAIGAVIGAIVGFFATHTPKPPEIQVSGHSSGISHGVENQAVTPFGTVYTRTSGSGQLPSADVLAAISKFDKAIADFLTPAEIASVTERLVAFDVDLKDKSATIENLLTERFNVMLTAFDEDVQKFVNGATTLQDRVQRLGDALAVMRTFDKLGLDITFGKFLELTDQLAKSTEKAGEAMARIVGEVQLLGGVFKFFGTTIQQNGEDFVKFADSVATAFGGLDAAKSAWDEFIQHFFSPEEIAQKQVDSARDTATHLFDQLGYETLPTMEQFKQDFLAALPTLSPEEIAQYVTAGNALGRLTDAEANLAQIRQQATDAAQQAAEAADKQREAAQQYASMVTDLSYELIGLTTGWQPTKFVQNLAAIRDEESQRVSQLNKLAQAAGLAGASEHDLAIVHQIAAAKAAHAIAELKKAAASLIQKLGYTQGTDDGFVGSIAAGLSGVDSQAQSMFEAWQNAIQKIKEFLDSILLDTKLTTLTPQEQLTEAQRQFNVLLDKAKHGDADAAAKLPDLARDLLDKARTFWASGEQYDAIFNAVMAGLRDVAGIQGPEAPPPDTGGIADIQQAQQEAEAAAEEVRQQRLLMATELAGYLRDLGEVLGQNVLQLAVDMGVNLQQFITDLGVDLTHLSVGTATQLAGIANMLGVELSDLTDQLGISLGSLADANSYLNDALEGAINEQPPEIRDQLTPLLHAIETATSEADANAAIGALEDAVNTIGGATAVALSPYLDNVDPPSMADQIAAMQHIDDATSTYLPQINSWLEQIANSPFSQPSQSYAQGSAGLSEDQVAMVHEGEKIIDARSSALLDQYGIQVKAPKPTTGTDKEARRLTRELLAEIKDLNRNNKDLPQRLADALTRQLSVPGRRG